MHIAFIDHGFHAHTKSSDFFVDLLYDLGVVRHFYIDPLAIAESLKSCGDFKEYDLVIFWQIQPHVSLISHIPRSKVLFVPMYDACCTMTYRWWSRYRGYRFLSFSRRIHKLLLDLKIESHYVQYVPELPKLPCSVTPEPVPTIFVWKRTPHLHLDRLFAGLRAAGIQKAVCHEFSAADQMRDFPIAVEFTQGWFPTHTDYLKTIARCGYYLAPRSTEGIGMSFLEAMGLGLCVLSPDRPTMNEYIISGHNGILFHSFSELKRKDLFGKDLGKEAQKTFVKLRAIWEENLPTLRNYLQSPPEAAQTKISHRRFWLKDLSIKWKERNLPKWRLRLNKQDY